MNTHQLKRYLHPALEINDKGTGEELKKLAQTRVRFIRYAMRENGLSYSEAEKIVDRKTS